MLSIKSINAKYQDQCALRDVTLHIAKGETLLVIGPNGSGKTTLLKVIAGLLRPTSGEIFFGEKEISSYSTNWRVNNGLGYLMQDRNIFPSLTVQENLRLSFWNCKADFADRQEWVLYFFPILKGLLKRRAGLLSCGERQALAICMILIKPIDILVLDEPTAGLSPKMAASILEALHAAKEAAALTSIIVEHNLHHVQPWISRFLVMNQGQVVMKQNDPATLFDHEMLQKYYFS